MKQINYGEEFKANYVSDVASLKIGTPDFMAFYSNHIGDGIHEVTVDVTDKCQKLYEKYGWEYDTMLLVKKTANIYHYDCGDGDDVIAVLPSGRYGIYHNDDGDMAVVWWDGSL